MSDLLSIGSSGILAYQYALTATSNNIANAAVEGYSRQEVELGTSLPRLVGVQFFGSGTYVQGLKRQSMSSSRQTFVVVAANSKAKRRW